MIRLMILFLSLVITAPAYGQATLVHPEWNPAADYITAGQDEPGYRSWFMALPSRPMQVKAFNDYLTTYEVAGIVPTWQLFRTATAWQRCAGQPFEIPPASQWPHIVQTLRYIRDYVVPAVGPVEPVSGYRNPSLNNCAGGAQESAHKHYSAVDLVPLRPTTREQLMQNLCAIHGRRGLAYDVGLGFYAFIRFHVDTSKYRRWNMDPAVASHCPPIVRPPDLASFGKSSVPVQATSQPASSATMAPTPPPPTTAVPDTVRAADSAKAPPAADPLAPQQ